MSVMDEILRAEAQDRAIIQLQVSQHMTMPAVSDMLNSTADTSQQM